MQLNCNISLYSPPNSCKFYGVTDVQLKELDFGPICVLTLERVIPGIIEAYKYLDCGVSRVSGAAN
jgi:hypothetical protein